MVVQAAPTVVVVPNGAGVEPHRIIVAPDANPVAVAAVVAVVVICPSLQIPNVVPAQEPNAVLANAAPNGAGAALLLIIAVPDVNQVLGHVVVLPPQHQQPLQAQLLPRPPLRRLNQPYRSLQIPNVDLTKEPNAVVAIAVPNGAGAALLLIIAVLDAKRVMGYVVVVLQPPPQLQLLQQQHQLRQSGITIVINKILLR